MCVFLYWTSKLVRVGLGGLEVTCSPGYSRFVGSNPTEVDGFFMDVKILSPSLPRGTLSWGSRVWNFRLVKESHAWKNKPLSQNLIHVLVISKFVGAQKISKSRSALGSSPPLLKKSYRFKQSITLPDNNFSISCAFLALLLQIKIKCDFKASSEIHEASYE